MQSATVLGLVGIDDGLAIQQVSDLLGVPAPTLRSWERRYGVPTTPRTSGGHRRYSAHSIRELKLMRDEIARGRRAADAARAVRELLDPANPDRRRIEAFLSACEDQDLERLVQVLDEATDELGLADTLDRVLLPALRQVGAWWESGQCEIPVEQVVTETVRTWLAGLCAMAPEQGSGPPVLLACGPLDRHTVGLEAFGALLIEAGVACAVIPAGSTPDELVAAAAALDAPAVVLLSHLSTHRRRAREALAALADTGRPIFYAGNAFLSLDSRRSMPGSYLGESVGTARDLLLTALTRH